MIDLRLWPPELQENKFLLLQVTKFTGKFVTAAIGNECLYIICICLYICIHIYVYTYIHIHIGIMFVHCNDMAI